MGRSKRPKENNTNPVAPSLGPLAEAIWQTVASMESAPLIRQSLAIAYWPQVVGEQGAKASRAEMVRSGILFVRTRSATWSQELALHKHTLINKLAKLLGPNVINDIVFRAHGIDEDPKSIFEEEPSVEELEKVALTREEQELLWARQAELQRIPNPRVREAIARRLDLDARLYHWRLERGWKACTRCGSLHKTAYSICPLCRLEGS